METELYFTIYSNSMEYGINQIESTFRVLFDFAQEKLKNEMLVISEKNRQINDITYAVVVKTKKYVRRKYPFNSILTPKYITFNFPNNLLNYKNVIFK